MSACHVMLLFMGKCFPLYQNRISNVSDILRPDHVTDSLCGSALYSGRYPGNSLWQYLKPQNPFTKTKLLQKYINHLSVSDRDPVSVFLYRYGSYLGSKSFYRGSLQRVSCHFGCQSDLSSGKAYFFQDAWMRDRLCRRYSDQSHGKRP